MIHPSKRIIEINEYFFSLKMKKILKLQKRGIKIINMGIGNPDLLPPKEVIKKMQEASKLKNANKYQSYNGITKLRQNISLWYKHKYGVNINSDSEILPLIGSKEGIMHISMSYLNIGDSVLIPNPGYPTYTSVSKIMQTKIIKYKLNKKNNWQIDLQEIEKIKNLKKCKILWINSTHMPTGSVMSKNNILDILKFSKKNKILLVNDNPYSLINNSNPISIFQFDKKKEISLELNSLSKCYNMAGWRIGMVLGNKTFIKNILKTKSQMDSGMYLPIQFGAIEALQQTNKWNYEIDLIYSKRKKIIHQICDIMKLSYNSNSKGIFVWAKLPRKNSNDINWCDNVFNEKNIFITPGSIFGSEGKGYVRISMCCPTKEIIEAKRRIEE